MQVVKQKSAFQYHVESTSLLFFVFLCVFRHLSHLDNGQTVHQIRCRAFQKHFCALLGGGHAAAQSRSSWLKDRHRHSIEILVTFQN